MMVILLYGPEWPWNSNKFPPEVALENKLTDLSWPGDKIISSITTSKGSVHHAIIYGSDSEALEKMKHILLRLEIFRNVEKVLSC